MPRYIPAMIPAGDTEAVRKQTTQKINDIGRSLAQSSNRTESMDLGGNRVTSVADPGNPTDAVNLRTLKKHLDDITTQRVQRNSGAGTGLFSVVFAANGTLVSGQRSAPYIIMPNRTGRAVTVKIATTGTGTADATFNIARNGVNILAADATLSAGATGPITVMNFVAGLPAFVVNDLLTPVVSVAGGTSYVTIEVEIQS